MLSRPLLAALEQVRRRNGYAVPRTGRALHAAIARRLPAHADVELLPGIRAELDLRQPVELQSWWQGARYEHPTVERLDGWAAAASAFFDIGANYGFFSLRAVAAGCPEVHAFEPNPDLHARLQRTAERNALTALHCHCLGLGDTAERLELAVRGDDLGHSSLGPRSWPGAQRVEVDVTTFDGWRAAAGLPLPEHPAWVAKVDVEGYELHVVRGMAEALAARAFLALVVELNELTLEASGASSEAVVAALAEAGYDLVERAGSDAVANGFFRPAAAGGMGRA